MNELQVREILKDSIQPDGGLFNTGQYMAWTPGDRSVALDDEFTANELAAIAWWMQNGGAKK